MTASAPRALRVLIADDSAAIREALSVALQLLGHVVDTAPTGTDAMRCLEALAVDLALIDVDMPGASGYEVAAQTAAWPSRPLMVAMTGWSREADRTRALRSGFDRHLVKPIGLDDLRGLLRDVIAQE